MRARITSDFAFGARPIRIENWSLAIENHLPGRPMTDDKLSIFNSQLLSRARSQAPLRSCSNCASISEVVFARGLSTGFEIHCAGASRVLHEQTSRLRER